MSSVKLDCRGLPCPQPVLQCKHCLDKERPETICVLVDNEAARENVTRFLKTQGFQSECQGDQFGRWTIQAERIKKNSSTPAPGQSSAKPSDQDDHAKILIFLGAARIGTGDDSLGEKLMVNFLATLPEMGSLWRMILVNEAVTLAVEGSPVLDSLNKLEAQGVSILVCGTCLTHFNLLEKKAVGQTTNMLDVVTSLQLAGKVIRP